MGAIHGRGGMVYLQGTGAAAIKIVQARSWKFTLDRNLDEDNHLGDQWVTQLEGLRKWTGTVEGNFDTTDTTAFDAAVQSGIMALYLYPVATSTTRYYYGTIWPKIDVSLSFDATVRFTADFEGDGQLAYN